MEQNQIMETFLPDRISLVYIQRDPNSSDVEPIYHGNDPMRGKFDMVLKRVEDPIGLSTDIDLYVLYTNKSDGPNEQSSMTICSFLEPPMEDMSVPGLIKFTFHVPMPNTTKLAKRQVYLRIPDESFTFYTISSIRYENAYQSVYDDAGQGLEEPILDDVDDASEPMQILTSSQIESSTGDDEFQDDGYDDLA